MTQLRTLIIIAFIANLLTLLLYNYAANQPGGSGVAMIFILVWMPALWLTSIITTIIISVIKWKYLFKKPVVRWTLLTLLFTTPIPAIAFYYVTHPTPETRSDGMLTNTINGKVYKTEFCVIRHNWQVISQTIKKSLSNIYLSQIAYPFKGSL